MKTINLIFALLFSLGLFAQVEDGDWSVYMAEWEDGPGSVLLRMDLVEEAPFKKYPILLIVGASYEGDEVGLPSSEELDEMGNVEDVFEEDFLVDKKRYIDVGTFTYNKERLRYIYFEDSTNLREEVRAYYDKNYPDKSIYINVKEDAKWDAYLEFLYPNEEIMEYMGDQYVVLALLEQGDDLSKARPTDFWIYFNSKKELKNFYKEIKFEGFKKKGIRLSDNELYELIISKNTKVDLNTIYPLGQQIRKIAKKYNGDYDGWETMVLE